MKASQLLGITDRHFRRLLKAYNKEGPSALTSKRRGIGINPREYLEDVMKRIISHSNQKLFELLPDYWLKNR